LGRGVAGHGEGRREKRRKGERENGEWRKGETVGRKL
jgi:hypothetical protein